MGCFAQGHRAGEQQRCLGVGHGHGALSALGLLASMSSVETRRLARASAADSPVLYPHATCSNVSTTEKNETMRNIGFSLIYMKSSKMSYVLVVNVQPMPFV